MWVCMDYVCLWAVEIKYLQVAWQFKSWICFCGVHKALFIDCNVVTAPIVTTKINCVKCFEVDQSRSHFIDCFAAIHTGSSPFHFRRSGLRTACVCVYEEVALILHFHCRTWGELSSELQGVGCCWSSWWWHISSRSFLLQQQCTSGCDLQTCTRDWFHWHHCKYRETKWHYRYCHATPLYSVFITQGPVSFNDIGIRPVNTLRVLQYRNGECLCVFVWWTSWSMEHLQCTPLNTFFCSKWLSWAEKGACGYCTGGGGGTCTSVSSRREWPYSVARCNYSSA